jgi:hypothetical protein
MIELAWLPMQIEPQSWVLDFKEAKWAVNKLLSSTTVH